MSKRNLRSLTAPKRTDITLVGDEYDDLYMKVYEAGHLLDILIDWIEGSVKQEEDESLTVALHIVNDQVYDAGAMLKKIFERYRGEEGGEHGKES